MNKIRQVSITLSEFTRRCDIKSIWQFTAFSFQIYIEKMWKTVVQACKLLKSLSKKPWGSSKEILLIYYFSLPDEGGENKIYQFLSFSVYFWKFWLRQGGLSFYGFQKGDEGVDTDLMFQFCLPNMEKAVIWKDQQNRDVTTIQSLFNRDTRHSSRFVFQNLHGFEQAFNVEMLVF